VTRLSASWEAGKPTFGAWVTSFSEAAVDVLVRAGYDYVGVDCQHTVLSESEAARLVQPLVNAGVPVAVRVSRNDPALIGRVADAGADVVIVPLVDTAEEAAAAVAACRYPPHGVRSYGPFNATLGLDPVYLEARVRCFVMVESALAIDRLEAICATPGLGGLYVGPGDLSISMGTSWLLRPRPEAVMEAIARVPPVCRAAGIVPGMHAGSGVLAAELVGLGFRMVTLMSDTGLLGTGAARDLAAAREAAGTG